jgi:hypothetical protein
LLVLLLLLWAKSNAASSYRSGRIHPRMRKLTRTATHCSWRYRLLLLLL